MANQNQLHNSVAPKSRTRLLNHKIIVGGLVLSAIALSACQGPKTDTTKDQAQDESAVAKALPAQSLPARKPGLWQTVVSEEGSEETPHRIEICIDAATDKGLGILGNDLSGDRCEKTVNKVSDTAWDILAECRMGTGGVNEYAGNITGDYSQDYSLRVRSQTTGAELPQMNRVTTYNVKSKRLGPCKDGQVGGDVVGDGIALNLFVISGSSPQ